ncbi:MAG: heparinase II/III family protein [Planctomycetes bacterium]|nr:heparinase II/III family protein [Planctomycetota bacterium]
MALAALALLLADALVFALRQQASLPARVAAAPARLALALIARDPFHLALLALLAPGALAFMAARPRRMVAAGALALVAVLLVAFRGDLVAWRTRTHFAPERYRAALARESAAPGGLIPSLAAIRDRVSADPFLAARFPIPSGDPAAARRWLAERAILWSDGSTMRLPPGGFPPWYGADLRQYTGPAFRDGWNLAHALPFIGWHLAVAAMGSPGRADVEADAERAAHLYALREWLANFFATVRPEDAANVPDNAIFDERRGPTPWRGLAWDPSGVGERLAALVGLLRWPLAARLLTPALQHQTRDHLLAIMRHRHDQMSVTPPTNHLWLLAADQLAACAALADFKEADVWRARAEETLTALLVEAPRDPQEAALTADSPTLAADLETTALRLLNLPARRGLWLREGPPVELYPHYFPWQAASLLATARFCEDVHLAGRCRRQAAALLAFTRGVSAGGVTPPINCSQPLAVAEIEETFRRYGCDDLLATPPPARTWPEIGARARAGLFALRAGDVAAGDMLLFRSRAGGYRAQHDACAVYVAVGGRWVIGGVGAPPYHSPHHTGYGDRDRRGDPRGMNTLSADGFGQRAEAARFSRLAPGVIRRTPAAPGPRVERVNRLADAPATLEVEAWINLSGPRALRHTRRVALVAGRVWAIIDRLDPPGGEAAPKGGRPAAEVRVKFQFAPWARVEAEEGAFIVHDAPPGRPLLRVVADGAGLGEVVTGRALNEAQARARHEPRYEGWYGTFDAPDGLLPAPALIFKVAAPLPHRAVVLLAPGEEAARDWRARLTGESALISVDGDPVTTLPLGPGP